MSDDTEINPDPTWSVCPVCWAVVASSAGHAATHTPPDGQDDAPPADTPEEP